MKKIYYGTINESLLGQLWVAVSGSGLWSVDFGVSKDKFLGKTKRKKGIELIEDQTKAQAVLNQISEFLFGKRKSFDLMIDYSEMTDFQIAVLKATYAVEAGKTSTYGELAVVVGSPGAARAVGRVQATNPIPLVIPCHRILSSDGKLHGYGGAGGLETKAWLLKLEGAEI